MESGLEKGREMIEDLLFGPPAADNGNCTRWDAVDVVWGQKHVNNLHHVLCSNQSIRIHTQKPQAVPRVNVVSSLDRSRETAIYNQVEAKANFNGVDA